jgi:hypothetical protein
MARRVRVHEAIHRLERGHARADENGRHPVSPARRSARREVSAAVQAGSGDGLSPNAPATGRNARSVAHRGGRSAYDSARSNDVSSKSRSLGNRVEDHELVYAEPSCARPG